MSLIFTGADVIPHISHSSPVVYLCCIFPFKSGESACPSIGLLVKKTKCFITQPRRLLFESSLTRAARDESLSARDRGKVHQGTLGCLQRALKSPALQLPKHQQVRVSLRSTGETILMIHLSCSVHSLILVRVFFWKAAKKQLLARRHRSWTATRMENHIVQHHSSAVCAEDFFVACRVRGLSISQGGVLSDVCLLKTPVEFSVWLIITTSATVTHVPTVFF